MSSPVPLEWTRLVAAHQTARGDREAMRTAATQQLRDEGAIRYGRTLDQIMESLTALDDQLQLGRITRLLVQGGR